MKILDFLNPKAVSSDLKAKDKEGIIKELLDLLIRTGAVKAPRKEAVFAALLERETLGSTGIGQDVGIPHAKTKEVKHLTGAVGISRSGVNFDSLDGEPAYIFFMLLAPQESAGPHLKALARISRLLKDKYFRDALKAARDPKSMLGIIQKEDSARH
jgi:PTS system nitrogen regulatory IIA component